MPAPRSSRPTIPDRVFYATNEHVLDEKGYGRGAVDRIITYYHQALAAHQAGDDEVASTAFGWIGALLRRHPPALTHELRRDRPRHVAQQRYEKLVDR